MRAAPAPGVDEGTLEEYETLAAIYWQRGMLGAGEAIRVLAAEVRRLRACSADEEYERAVALRAYRRTRAK